ncbi:MAG: hypothetical protein AAGA48_04420 [Myxococcota bacterium]
MFLRNVVLPLFLVGCAKTTPLPAVESRPTSFEAEDLVGVWRSGCVDPGNGQGITLDFDLDAKDWQLDYAVHVDSTCGAPFLTVHIAGPYELGPASSIVEGAREGTFRFSTKGVTPYTEAAVDFLASAEGCNRDDFGVTQESNLAPGCPGLGQYPIQECDTDYDVVRLDSDGLRFGARPADNNMCTPQTRPTELSDVFLAADEA